MISVACHGLGGRERAALWFECLRTLLPAIRFLDLAEAKAEGADVALVWRPPLGALAAVPRLRVIISLGQGVDHLLTDPQLPTAVPVVRLVDPDMSHSMSHWVVHAVLDYLRDGAAYREGQRQRRFAALPQRRTDGLRIGIYGVGALGKVVAERLAALGFEVHGWSRTAKTCGYFRSHSGGGGLARMLEGMDIHVCLLPLTEETRHLFRRETFARMKPGAYFVNAARGGHVVEPDLCAAIDDGGLAGAALDVFEEEPLPEGHPFWTHPKIRVWPHVAAQTNPRTAARQVAEAITEAMAGRLPDNAVDLARGY